MSINKIIVEEPILNKRKNKIELVPFLKWAGGKRWLVSGYSHLFPRTYNTYYEPFLGSGAVFFFMTPEHGVLSDTNSELINTYSAIRDDWQGVEKILQNHQLNHSKNYYYEIRDQEFITATEKAAKFIYLNRTCWNGLYRVNLKGKFNVPIGTKSSVLLNTDDFQTVSSVLQNKTLISSDFEKTINITNKGDFLFVDPPYTVKHNNNGFIKYNESIFSWEDQVRLSNALMRASNRGVKILMTNADHDSIRNLYKNMCNVESVKRSSVIAGKSVHRGTTTELIIRAGW